MCPNATYDTVSAMYTTGKNRALAGCRAPGRWPTHHPLRTEMPLSGRGDFVPHGEEEDQPKQLLLLWQTRSARDTAARPRPPRSLATPPSAPRPRLYLPSPEGSPRVRGRPGGVGAGRAAVVAPPPSRSGRGADAASSSPASPGRRGRRIPAARRARPATPPCPPAPAILVQPRRRGGRAAPPRGAAAPGVPSFPPSYLLGCFFPRYWKVHPTARQQARFSCVGQTSTGSAFAAVLPGHHQDEPCIRKPARDGCTT